jgi:xylulokinase
MTEFLFCLYRFTVKTSEGAAFGAALLAGVGVGTWKTIQQACEETIFTLEHTTPQTQTVAVYDQYYRQYTKLYPALKPTFDSLSAFG